MELNAEQIKCGLEHCTATSYECEECPYFYKSDGIKSSMEILMTDALALINSQEQRIKELTAKVAKWEEECDLRGDMWCKLNEENKKLTEENESLNESYTNLEQECKKWQERFQKMLDRISEHATGGYPRKVRLDVIEQIVKELSGEKI